MKNDIDPIIEGRKAERALKRAVARVMRENQKLGIPVAVMKNNRAVLLPVSEALKIKRS
ncbi:MAG TPA: hypothetical protein PLB62_03665 [Candidatus Sumerlaeota bacterium]|nr:hypothetical protein [Candidatus Sumerlaeota bacterium]